jgi:hypothetical protein
MTMPRTVWARLPNRVSGEDGGSGDGHGAEPSDDTGGHVHGNGDGGAVGDGGDGHHEDARDDVGEVAGSADAADALPEGAAQDVDEQQQEHDRHADEHQRQRRVALQAPQVAPQHRGRVGEGVGEGGHERAAVSRVG